MPFFSPRVISLSSRCLLVLLLSLGLCELMRSPAFASGTENNVRGEDLNITVDSRWAGCAHGGYYPIRIRVNNLGRERTIRFTYETYNHEGLPTVSKSVRMKPGAVLRFPLSIPMVGNNMGGTLKVSIDGSVKNSLQTPISLPDVDYSDFDRPAMLVISRDPLSLDPYEEAVTTLNATIAGSGSGYYGSSRSEDHEIIPPDMLPERWIDYSGLDLVAISLADFEGLSSDARDALVDWVKTGGNLLIFNVGVTPSESARLSSLTGLNDSAAAAAKSWNEPTRSQLQKMHQYEGDSYSGFSQLTSPPELASEQFLWSQTQAPFQVRNVMDGTIIAFSGDPFPGTRHEWAWLLRTLGENRYHWTFRHGLSSRTNNKEFLYFMIPGISGVPVVAFLILITAFSVVIGPLNYYFLTKQKRLYLLILTIPFIAFVTSVSLFGYSIVAHGFSTKSRIRSLTTVDQVANEAITTARVSLYSGLAPSGGLSFTADTAVYPVWPAEGGSTFESGSVDWTNQQALTSGWLKSRTRTQFYTVTKRDERGRLTISPVANNTLEISNGFEYDFKHLFVRGDDGKIYYGENIRAGREARLSPATAENGNTVTAIIRNARPELPTNYDAYSSSHRRGYSYYDDYDVYTQFNRNTMERQLEVLNTDSIDDFLGDHQYFGVLTENPDVPIGLTGTKERQSLHLLHGYY